MTNPTEGSAVPAGIANEQVVLAATRTVPIPAITIPNGIITALSNDSKFTPLCLSTDNWPKWSQKIMQVMKMSGLLGYLDGKVPKPNGETDPTSLWNWEENNSKIIGFLEAFVDNGELSHLATDTASTAWMNLRNRHEKQGPITQVRLIQELLSISYPKDVSTWAAVTERYHDLCTRIFSQAVPTFDVLFMVAMLNGLEREADHLRSEMTSYYITNTISTSEPLRKRIEQETIYKSRRENGPSDIALTAQTGRRNQNRTNSAKFCSNPTCPNPKGHLGPDCWEKGGVMEGKRDEVLARRAKAREERDKKKGENSGSTPASGILRDKSGRAYILDSVSGQAILLASDSPTPDTALSAVYSSMSDADRFEYDALFLDDHSASVDWHEKRRDVPADAFLASSMSTNTRTTLSLNTGPFILDSGATIHISPDTMDFFDLKPIPPRTIKGIGGSSISATGIGKIRLLISKGIELVLDPALFVPEASVRLISVFVLGSGPQKLISHFDGDGCWLTNRSGTTVASGKISPMGKRLYTLDMGSPLVEHTMIATRVPDIETWHRRLGHVNYQSIVDMSDIGMVKGMHVDLSSAPPKCQPCILGKQTRTPVPKKRVGARAKGILDVVYIDLTGPQPVQSASGFSYVMNLVDDASSYVYTCLLPLKSSAIKSLKEWVLFAERETGRKVGSFNIDNGELKSIEFAEFCASRGIKTRWTAPSTSAQNGRVERFHYTQFNSARTMRCASRLPPNRWDEFILTATYLRMRVPTKSLNNITPFEAYHKRKPDISHLREIGCRAFVLILNRHNPKMFPRSEEHVLIGYGKDSKTYRCYHRASHKVVESYHVVFVESKDELDVPFRPGVMQGLDDESIPPLMPPIPPIPKPNPNLSLSRAATPPLLPAPQPDALPLPAPSIPDPLPSRRSSRIPKLSARSAESSGIQQLSAVQRATAESIASKTRINEERVAQRHSRAASQNPPVPIVSIPPTREELIEIAYRAAEELSDDQTANILEQLYSDGFEWGLSTDIDVTSPEEPCSFEEAMASPDAPKWLAACHEEIESITSLKVFKLVPRDTASGRTIMDGKMVFKLKRDENGKPIRWKARFVVKGYSAIYGIDYNDTTAPTMRMETFRIVAHIAAVHGWELHQVDIKTAFLRGVLEPGEEVYMKQPKGFETKGKEDHIWELVKGLYGLPQGSRIWNKAMNKGMLSLGFTRIKSEYCLYFRRTPSGIILTGIHVDDFFIAASCSNQASQFKLQLASIWEISDLGEAKFCVGIAIKRDLAEHRIYLSQTALIDKILSSFNMTECNPVSTPMEAGLVLSRHSDVTLTRQEELELAKLPYRRLVGLLMYLAIATRPDIALAVQKLSQFMNYYREVHWNAAKRVVRYLKGTRTLQLRLGGKELANLVGFSDASYACCPDSGKSVGAYCFSLGDGVVSWAARKQKTVAQSTCDAEYIACSEAARECMWLRMLTAEIELPQANPTPVLTDNEAALALAKDPRFHARAKHINTRCHYIRECVDNGNLLVSYIPTNDNVADILTKPLAAPAFLRLRSYLGLCDLP
jgi:hypothetical protein